jgi:hypothetical protein
MRNSTNPIAIDFTHSSAFRPADGRAVAGRVLVLGAGFLVDRTFEELMDSFRDILTTILVGYA